MGKKSNHPWFKVITWQEAEKLLNHKVNRRLKFYTQSEEAKAEKDNPYTFPEHKVFTYAEFTIPCSGCSCDCWGGEAGGCAHGSSGCPECGFTGKSRQGIHAPYIIEHEIEFSGLKP